MPPTKQTSNWQISALSGNRIVFKPFKYKEIMKKIITLMLALLAIVGAQAEEKTVWEGEQAISWNPDEAPGTQYETPDGTFAGLQKGDVIRLYTTTTYAEPQYVITYKKGDSWEWTDLETTIADGVISYTVESDEVATWIAERGLIMRGQAYTLTKITVTKQSVTTIVVMQQSDVKDSRLYNLRGQMVDENYKGIVVSNGRKYLK